MTDFLHFIFPFAPETKERKLAREILTQLKGGDGSGNFGHAGRPGEVGGSTSAQTGGRFSLAEFYKNDFGPNFYAPGGWEEMTKTAPYVDAHNPDVLITLSPSTQNEGLIRINFWDKDGIRNHEEFTPEKLEKVLPTLAHKRGDIIIRPVSKDGKYPDSKQFEKFGFRPGGVSASGTAKRFEGPPSSAPSVIGRLRSNGYNVKIERVPDNYREAYTLKYSPDQPRDDDGKWTDNPYSNTESDLSGPLSKIADIGKQRLMPPQYQEMLSAIVGKTSESTKNYWFDVMRKWAETEYDFGEISESEYDDIIKDLS